MAALFDLFRKVKFLKTVRKGEAILEIPMRVRSKKLRSHTKYQRQEKEKKKKKKIPASPFSFFPT